MNERILKEKKTFGCRGKILLLIPLQKYAKMFCEKNLVFLAAGGGVEPL